MANFKSLVISAGKVQQVPDADTLIVGVGITAAGNSNITITPGGTGTTVSIASAKHLASVGGAANFDWSASSGTFSTGTGAVSLAGDTTVLTGRTLSTAGTGMIDLPNLFEINNVAVSANVTAANLTALTGGGTTALHSHAGSAAISATAGEALAVGEPGYVADSGGVAKVYRGDADAAATSEIIGLVGTAAAADGNATSIATTGELSTADARWDSVPAVADVGKRYYLSANIGKLTLTAPSAAGTTAIRLGWVTVGGTGAVKVAISTGEGVLN